jgi:hypothetical protein
MKLLSKAIAEWLRSDATLVSYTGHSSSDLRLMRDKAEVAVKIPSIVFLLDTNPIPTSARPLELTTIVFSCIGNTEIAVDNMQQRLKTMLAPNTTKGRLRGADPSNDDVRIISLEFEQVGVVSYNESIEAFSGDITARCFWHEK